MALPLNVHTATTRGGVHRRLQLSRFASTAVYAQRPQLDQGDGGHRQRANDGPDI